MFIIFLRIITFNYKFSHSGPFGNSIINLLNYVFCLDSVRIFS